MGWVGVERDEEEILRHKRYDWKGTAYLWLDQLVCGIEMWRGCCQNLAQLLPAGHEDGEGDHDDIVWRLMSSTRWRHWRACRTGQDGTDR